MRQMYEKYDYAEEQQQPWGEAPLNRRTARFWIGLAAAALLGFAAGYSLAPPVAAEEPPTAFAPQWRPVGLGGELALYDGARDTGWRVMLHVQSSEHPYEIADLNTGRRWPCHENCQALAETSALREVTR